MKDVRYRSSGIVELHALESSTGAVVPGFEVGDFFTARSASERKDTTRKDATINASETLQGLGQGDLSVLNTLLRMTEGSLDESGLDPETFLLVRIAVLATLEAEPASRLMNLKVSGEAGNASERIVGTLVAIAPVIGPARVVSTAGHSVRALGLASAIAENE